MRQHDVAVASQVGHADAGLDGGFRQLQVVEIGDRAQECIHPLLLKNLNNHLGRAGIQTERVRPLTVHRVVEARRGPLCVTDVEVGQDDEFRLAEAQEIVGRRGSLAAGSDDSISWTHDSLPRAGCPFSRSIPRSDGGPIAPGRDSCGQTG